MRTLEDERAFSEVGETGRSPSRAIRFAGPQRHVSDRPTILEMLALRRAAQRVVELTEMLLLALVPVTGGCTGPAQVRHRHDGSQPRRGETWSSKSSRRSQGLMPESLDLAATIVRAEPGQPVQALLDD